VGTENKQKTTENKQKYRYTKNNNKKAWKRNVSNF